MIQKVKDTLKRPCPFCGKPLYVERVFTTEGNWCKENTYCDCAKFRRANRIAKKFWRELMRSDKRIKSLSAQMKKIDIEDTTNYYRLGKDTSLVDAEDIRRRCDYYGRV